MLAGFRPGVSAGQRYAIERAAGAEGASFLGPLSKAAGRNAVEHEPLTIPLLLRVPSGQVLAVARRLLRYRSVAYAEPDYLMRAGAVPNDPLLPSQWGDTNTGQSIPRQDASEVLGPPASGTPGADDGALKAWATTTGNPSIVIGETDTGVDYKHPDLAANIWSNPGGLGGCPAATHGYNVLNGACDPMDDDTNDGGHGTHVAGILGAIGNNGIGVAGMNWHTSILPVKWLDASGTGGTSGLIAALQWLVRLKGEGVNIRVVNDSASFYGSAYSQALSDEIDTLGANGILFVTAAGNEGEDNDKVRRYPCGYDRPNEICVTASNNEDQLPSWANYGPHTVDLAAPGVSIDSTLRGGTFGYLSGGSMAAPQVAGAAALILSVAPALSARELKAAILDQVDVLPSLAGRVITGGRLDVDDALSALLSHSAPSQSAPSPPGGGTQASGRRLVHGATAAAISVLSISPPAFAAARSGPTISRRVGSVGATVSYRDSEAALIRFTVMALRWGVESPGHGCATPAHGRRKARGRRCIRYLDVGSFANQDRAGRNSFRFSGRIGGRELAPGRYRLQAVPTFGGRTGAGRAATFRIVR